MQNYRYMKFSSFISLLLISTSCFSQKANIPEIHSNINYKDGNYFVEVDGIKIPAQDYANPLTLENIRGKITGTASGLYFDFNDETLSGKLIFGLIPFNDSKHPQPVYFARSADIKTGRVAVNIANQLSGRYDMINWEATGRGTLGYRVIDASGNLLFDGHIAFKGTGPFEVEHTITEGPFINLLQADGATISFNTNKAVKASVTIGDKVFRDDQPGTHHEIKVEGLNSHTKYDYTVTYGDVSVTYAFETAPEAGTRTKFTFAYASDSRSGNGGGERNIHGTNGYIVKKIMALATQQEVKFMQFTGDLINGYRTSGQEMDLEYTNWKHVVEPFAHYFPVVATMGNHEALMRAFIGEKTRYLVDRFPYETESAEATFARNFVNPLNGPDSEDGASYDPNKKKVDFPSYKETAFYYTYDNVAVVVMNSDYWYAPSTKEIPVTGGGMHGYIMDQQLAWLQATIAKLETDNDIDHIFVSQHTPCFPNGGHTRDDMWYGGNNDFRPYVAGKPLAKGIIERRDQILDLLVNRSKKTRAILTGDEHNFAMTEIGPNTIIYDDNWDKDKIKLTRTIYQINNGAAGAPYYAQVTTPWSSSVSGFTTQNALVLFHVNGESLTLEVLNPDTLEKVNELKLR